MKIRAVFFFSQLAYSTSKEIYLPFALSFAVRLISNAQIIMLILSGSILAQQKDNHIAGSLAFILSDIKSVITLSQFNSETALQIVAYVCCLYTLSKLVILVYMIVKVCRNKKINSWFTRSFTTFSFLHNQLAFFPLYCFLLRLVNLSLNCEVNESFSAPFYCNSQLIIFACSIVFFHLAYGFLKELYCYKILNKKSISAVKDNLYFLIIFTQKAVIIPLLYFFDNLTTIIVVLNILFCLIALYTLQNRLPFYNLKILKLEISFSSINLLLSLFMLAIVFSDGSYILSILILIIPLAIKLNLLMLEISLKKILRKVPKNYYKAVHLISLLQTYLKQPKSLIAEKKTNKDSLIVSGFIQHYTKNQGSSEKTKSQAYMLAVEKLEDLLRSSPKNQLLLLYLAQTYIKKLKDAPKAIYLLNRIKAQNLSIPMRNSLEDLYSELDEMYHKACKEPTKKLNYLNYFEYREQTAKLKSLIQQEVLQQTNFWEILNENTINVFKAINQAEIINRARSKIETFWLKDIQGIEKEYVNASILYGAYLEVVQDLPHIGSALVKKSYKQILNKSLVQKKIMDISTGKSAIIIASSEADTAGKIIDSSSSVKQLFDIDKEHLVGSNINVIIPKVLTKKHDIMIQNFHKRFKYDMNSTFVSYAKSFNDQYFPVEISLHALPSLKKGLNIVACIKKLASSISLVIIDYNGKVLECSRDLQKLLTINGTGNYIDLNKICSDLPQVNQAFNMVYATEELQNDSVYADYQQLLENEPLSGTTKLSGALNSPIEVFSTRELLVTNKYNEDFPKNNIEIERNLLNSIKTEDSPFLLKRPRDLSATISREFLLTNKDNEELVKSNLEVEKNISNSLKTEDVPFILRKPKELCIMMSREEAEAICNDFKEKKRLKFSLSGGSGYSKINERTSIEAEIEPLLFYGTLFKIIKFKNLKNNPEETSSVPKVLISQRNNVIDTLMDKKINTKMSFKPEEFFSKKITTSTQKMDAGTLSPDEISNMDSEKSQENYAKLELQVKNPSRRSRATSGINSVKSSRNQSRNLHNIFTNQKISYVTKLAILIVFLSVFIVIGSVCLNLIFSTNSLSEMNDSIDLIYLTNTRLFRLLAAWRGVLIIYSRSVKLRPDSASLIAQYKGVVKNSSAEMLKNNNLLRELVNEFEDEFVTRQFFERKISLWLPYENVTVNRGKVDLFTANQIISNKNLFVANAQGAVTNLKNRTEVIFALNNTANDFWVAVMDSISDVKTFFDSTHTNNISILKLNLLFENLAIIISFLSLLVLFKIIIETQKNLFRVISKIKKHCVEERMIQLNKINTYLKGDVEDRIIFYQDHIQNSNKAKLKNEKAKRIEYSRKFSLKDLIWNMNKYLLFAFTLMSLIIALFWISYVSSIQGFNNLSRICSQILVTYEYGGQISSILSILYYTLIFASEPVFKVRNDGPGKQLNVSITYLRTASDSLLATLSTPGIGIENPAVEKLLKNDLCSYMTPENKQICITNTNYNSIGLLGINAKFYRTCGLPILDYLAYPTATRGKNLLDNIVGVLGDMHMISFDGYESLARILISDFKAKISEQEEDNLMFFKYNLIVILVMMLLITLIVITKYKNLDLAVKKVLILIPYEIIEKNKVIIFYLSKKYPKELSNLKNIQ